MPTTRLTRFHTPRNTKGVVLLLHGGQQTSHDEVEYWHASWLRMALVGLSLRRFARQHSLGVVLLRYRLRGWNDPSAPDPVTDARTTLQQLQRDHPRAPIALVGHSMGGRTACRVADEPTVAGVCGLAPWLPQGEPTEALRGKSLHVIHGTDDRWTSPGWSQNFVERARPIAMSTRWVSMPDVGHFMLRHVGEWNEFVEVSTTQILGLTTMPQPPLPETE